MKKYFNLMLIAFFIIATCCNNKVSTKNEFEENDAYDNPHARDEQEFRKTVDPALGIVPQDRLWLAMEQAHLQDLNPTYDGVTGVWTERGPTHDSVFASGNPRGQNAGSGPGCYTSGRIKAFCVDLADTTGNTAFCAGVAGGIWKCTNLLSTTAVPDWIPLTDYLSNLSIFSICQSPANNDIFYAATGEPAYISSSPRGNGLYKSIDHGLTWTSLTNTTSLRNGYKILCDAAGNVYNATASGGLRRSIDGGTTWTVISPSGLTNCSDIEISKTGKLHASFGDGGGGSASLAYRYTATPATVTPTTWKSATIPFGPTPGRFEIAVVGDTVYGITYNRNSYMVGTTSIPRNNIDFTFRSVNGGASWTKMNTTAYTEFTNTQGWYTLTLGVNPTNPEEIVLGCLDVYKSTDGGISLSQVSDWVGAGEYVHADQHSFTWWVNGANQSKLVCTSDGGIYLSEDDGASWRDRNRNLRIKQFYSCAVHPTTNNYYLAGAQDNGIHQFKYAGLNSSREVVGGDGMFVDIDNNQPNYQFSAYVGNAFRKSTNSGVNWSTSLNLSTGDFVNPWDYDDLQKIILAGSGAGDFLRWTNPQSGNTYQVVTLSELGGRVGCVTASPYTTGTAYFGSQSGQVIKVNNSKTTTGTGSADVTDITPPSPGTYASCIAVGTDDNNLMVTYSNYGVSNISVTTDGGTNWTVCDGNLPDLPVRWAVFHPTLNTAAVIGTELGVFTTTNINGASTIWTRSPGFPLAAVYMIKVRKNTNELVAATFGRGLWTANILDILPLKKIILTGNLLGENTTNLSWNMVDATTNAKYSLEYCIDGINFKSIAKTTNDIHSYKHQLTADKGYYRIVGIEPHSNPIYSNVIAIKSNKNTKGVQVTFAQNPMSNSGKILVNSTSAGEYTWQICNVQGSVLHIGKSTLQIGLVETLNFNPAILSSGMYVVKVTQNGQTKTTQFIKQ